MHSLLSARSFLQASAPRRVQLAVAGFAAAALLAAQMPVEAADVKTVVCASNPTSKICLKVSGAATFSGRTQSVGLQRASTLHGTMNVK